jgi:hypothetical protein
MRTLACIAAILLLFKANAQEAILPPTKAAGFLAGISKQYAGLQKALDKQSAHYLQKMQQAENNLLKKMAKKDSAAAAKLKASSPYAALNKKLQDTSTKQLKEYLPNYDTLLTTTNYLENKAANNPQLAAQAANAKATLQQFGSKLQASNELKKLMRERRQQLQEQLQKLGMVKQIQGVSKQVYYYQQQVNEYKALLKDKQKLQQKALAALRESSLFKDFMKRNSLLAQLFKVPDNYGTPQSLAGLQTTASVQQLIGQRVAAGGPNAQQMLQQNLQQAQNQLKQLKDRVNQLGGSSSSAEMPQGFKPNTQKTKRFLKRIEYGLNFQSQKPRGILPVTTDIALTAGYKMNDKSIIGLGASYKLGWGSGIKDIHLSSQGAGLRSYVDMKLKGSFWITGGYEMNYQQAFQSYEQLQQWNAWQRSGLLGLTKKYKLGKKQYQAQILWDFLSYQQTPRTEAIKFRVGYKL